MMQRTLSRVVAAELLLVAGLSREEHAHVEHWLPTASDTCWEWWAALSKT